MHPDVELFAQGVFSPGIPANLLGTVVTSSDGSVTVDNNQQFVSLEDLGTWTGAPPVSSGHVLTLRNPDFGAGPSVITTIPFDMPAIASPPGSGIRDSEVVTYQFSAPYTLCFVDGVDCGRLELPGSGGAHVFATPEPGVFGLSVFGFFTLCLFRTKRLS